MSQEKKEKQSYATVYDDEGVNYRDIADTMTELGHPMGHSSARNHTIRIMKKFVEVFAERLELSIDDNECTRIAASPLFQSGMADVLHKIEAQRRCEEQDVEED